MFDFLIDDAADALAQDYKQHGEYRPSTLKSLGIVKDSIKNEPINAKLVLMGLPRIPSLKELPAEKVQSMIDLVTTPQQDLADYSSAVGSSSVQFSGEYASLADIQKTAIAYILDYHDKRPIRVKLKDLNVTTNQYQKWLQDAKFQKLLQDELSRRFKYLDIDAKLSLSKLVLDGDLQAIKYYYEFTGLYRPNNETTVNLTVIMAKLMDVLVRHIEPEVLDTVALAIEREILMPDSQRES